MAALLQVENIVDLKEAHREWIEAALKKSKDVRESKWTQSIAVGNKSFLDQIKNRLGIMIALSLKIDIFFSSFSNLSINYCGPTPLETYSIFVTVCITVF